MQDRLSFIPRQEGTLRLKDLIEPMKYFDPKDGSYHSFIPTDVITVKNRNVATTAIRRTIPAPVLALECSGSMRMRHD